MNRNDIKRLSEAYFDGAQDNFRVAGFNDVKDELHDLIRKDRGPEGNKISDELSHAKTHQQLDKVIRMYFGSDLLTILDGMMRGELDLNYPPTSGVGSYGLNTDEGAKEPPNNWGSEPTDLDGNKW